VEVYGFSISCVKSEGISGIDRMPIFMYFSYQMFNELLFAPSSVIVDAEKRREAEA
jgi:hypothetical protein